VKQVILYSLVLSLLISSSAKTVLLADYLLNYTYISKVLCINRDKPQMHCNGKCHLAKELKAQEERDGANQKSTVHFAEIDCELHSSQTKLPALFSDSFEYHNRVPEILDGSCGSIEHPPSTPA
jgi:hypothetical protein